ncbi:MAG: tRNA methyltransferase complex GCD14 subunit-domain-containing protein [Olpidium bornovanus]|uniref:tRNA (adenine(58)-N(1))-methyltransferase catalytic subunit TRM61 n=1 Tax=Olpidium bornovanus TaxID=278681 RepID=A0A8H7ZMP8_9FUNG|nr:MAG: tRNA methyltransferase complex GCD14 subunit-domain-containing protein [Olpidium bornovanus]
MGGNSCCEVCIQGRRNYSAWDAPFFNRFDLQRPDREQRNQCGRICCFSPCIEQVQRTCAALRENRFRDITMFECLAKPLDTRKIALPSVHDAIEVAVEHQNKRARLLDERRTANLASATSTGEPMADGDPTTDNAPKPQTVVASADDEPMTENAPKPTETELASADDEPMTDNAPKPTETALASADDGSQTQRCVAAASPPGGKAGPASPFSRKGKQAAHTGRGLAVSMPPDEVRGHTSYLTFATFLPEMFAKAPETEAETTAEPAAAGSVESVVASDKRYRICPVTKENIDDLRNLHAVLFPVRPAAASSGHIRNSCVKSDRTATGLGGNPCGRPGSCFIVIAPRVTFDHLEVYFRDTCVGAVCCRREAAAESKTDVIKSIQAEGIRKNVLYIVTLGVLAPYRNKGLGKLPPPRGCRHRILARDPAPRRKLIAESLRDHRNRVPAHEKKKKKRQSAPGLRAFRRGGRWHNRARVPPCPEHEQRGAEALPTCGVPCRGRASPIVREDHPGRKRGRGVPREILAIEYIEAGGAGS